MSLPALRLSTARADLDMPHPPCPACAIAMRPAGAARRAYWLCSSCGTAMPRH